MIGTVSVHATTSDNVLLDLGLGRIGIIIIAHNQIVFDFAGKDEKSEESSGSRS